MVTRQQGSFNSPTFLLGKDTGTGETVTVSLPDLLTGFYLIGSSGSGKTTLLVNMALQAIAQGVGLAFLTPHGDAIDDILARLKPGQESNVILLDVSAATTFGLNIFQCNPNNEREVSITLNTVVELFGRLFTESGDLAKEGITMFESITALTLLLIFNQGYTLADVPTILSDKALALRLADNLPLAHKDMKRWWEEFFNKKTEKQDETVGSLKRRLMFFLSDLTSRRIFGSAKTTIDLREIMNNSGKILLVKLDRQRQQLTNLVGATLVSRVALAAFSRQNIPEASRRPFMLLCDEYHRFATDTFAELLAEVRKYRIATCVAHQFRDQLDTANKGATLNSGNLAVFRVQGADAEELSHMFAALPASGTNIASANIIQQLSRDSHPDPAVNAFVMSYLRKLTQARSEDAEEVYLGRGERKTVFPVWRYTAPSLPGACLYGVDPNDVKKGLVLCNDYLYACVRSGNASEDPPAEMLQLLSHILQYSNFWRLSTQPNRYETFVTKAPVSLQAPALEVTGAMALADMLLEDQNRYQGSTPDIMYTDYLFVYEGEVTQGNVTDIATALWVAEKRHYMEFVNSLKAVARALISQPLLADGHKYGVSGSSLIAEAEKAIQQQLTHPPRFGFRVRLGEREYTAQALPLPAPTRSVPTLTQQITQSCLRFGYLRDKASVDRDLNSRVTQSSSFSSYLPALASPLSPVFQPTDMPPVFVSEEEFDDTPPAPQYTEKEEAYRKLYMQMNGRYPSHIPFSEKPDERARRLCLEMNGYAPVPRLFSGQSNVPAPSPPVPEKNTRAAKPTPKQHTRKKRSKQEEEE